MSNIPQTTTEQAIPAVKRSDTVIMGRQDFLSVLLRSIGGELYKLRQWAMLKILLSIAILIMIIGFSSTALVVAFSPHTSCILDNNGKEHCIPLSQADFKRQIEVASAPLRLPDSLSTSVNVINFIGTISLLILTGSIVGSEYAVGTIRLMLTRGPTRTQFLLAKIGTVIISILITLFLLILVGIIVGALFNLMTGIAINFGFLTGEWILHATLYILLVALGLFVYSMIALCLATIGKTTAAGVAGALLWWFFEDVLAIILTGVGSMNKGPFGELMQSIPDYFIGSNISVLCDHQRQYLINGARPVTLPTNAHSISDMHAIIVLAVYLVLFIGLAWWANQQRDITS